MAQARWKKTQTDPFTPKLARILREVALYVFGAFAIYMLVSLLSYSPQDPGWSHSGNQTVTDNLGGPYGAWFADFFFQVFGYMAYSLPLMAAYAGWRLFYERSTAQALDPRQKILIAIGSVLTIAGGCGLENLHFAFIALDKPFVAGGIIGDILSRSMVSGFGPVGTTLFLLATFLSGVTLLTSLSWFWVMDTTGRYAFELCYLTRRLATGLNDTLTGVRARHLRQDSVAEIRKQMTRERRPRIEPQMRSRADSGRAQREKQGNLFTDSKCILPPLSLLDSPTTKPEAFSKQSLEAMSHLVEKKLNDFNLQVEVVGVQPGPVITRFELEPSPGIKASQITALSKDLARALSVVSVRVVENIPGKTVVGLELPNEQRETVRLVEGLSARGFEEANTPLPLMLGKDIGGSPVVADLCKMPHLLIGGTTGSGKSVCINALILSMLYKSGPDQVRLIMVDPKMLELSVYDGIPHLLAPVVTDMKQAANALRWCIYEMERRYRLMAALGVRNVSGFNRKVMTASKARRPLLDPLVEEGQEAEKLATLPYIVVIIDELADLMMVVGKKVEELITRLAQRARASGIHLILATQRPSVDVITGLIKANIPARIAFQVSSRVDSRTILDQMGAEQLLGHGDMLYMPAGSGSPLRVHGGFVSDEEVHEVVAHLKENGNPDYDEQILEGPTVASGVGGGNDIDEMDSLYDEALHWVTETRRASISAVQRRLHIGYNRAARMIETMEGAGVVGPLQSNGRREVLAPPPPKD
ncbi:MAG TPA: DNA translocase FtsK [Acidiferrobacteraceae bacterium]|nr:DNA translocase FtsK [Acidiferrobacteraceae bacterium]